MSHIVIVGGGFGGLSAAKTLLRTGAEISIIDRHNYHLFQPLLYQVAASALSPADIAYPIRGIFSNKRNVRVYLGEVTKLLLSERRIFFGSGELNYDYLILAPGATHSYFNHPEWSLCAPGLKSIDDAILIRKRILLSFEEAEYEGDEAERRRKLTFVVVGGGPTGVELCGALKEIAANSIPMDFRNVDTKSTRVVLIEAHGRVLSSMAPSLSEAAKRDLERLGVEIRLNSRVTSVDRDGVSIGEERIEAQNVFWAAGVRAEGFLKEVGLPTGDDGRARVGPDLSVPGHPEVFVIGDAAAMSNAKTGSPVPGVAQAAIQSGSFVAKIIAQELKGGPRSGRPAFSYADKGSMATIGRARAVAEIGRFRFTGLIAWGLWSLVHILALVGFRNRLSVLLAWAWSYIMFHRGARLITGPVEYSVRHFEAENPERRDSSMGPL